MSDTPQPVAASAFRVVRGLTAIMLVVGFLGGVIAIGRWGRSQLQPDARFRISLTELECAAPPGLTRQEFLAEIQYLTRHEERLSVLDQDLVDRLRPLFEAHPWVEAFDRITVTPPRRVEVFLQFRRPVLALVWDGVERAVDARGVLLPSSARTEGLPRFHGKPRPPQGPAGTRWGDEEVERQAKQAKQDR